MRYFKLVNFQAVLFWIIALPLTAMIGEIFISRKFSAPFVFVIGVSGAILYINGIIKKQKKIDENLINNGRKVYATYLGAVNNLGRRISCMWTNPETGVEYYFESRDYLINIDNRVKGKEILVYLNEETGDYIVDLDKYTTKYERPLL